MKIFKTITLGMVCLFGVTVFAVEPTDSSENSSAEDAVKECSLQYPVCDDLYPDSFEGFDDCMRRGGC